MSRASTVIALSFVALSLVASAPTPRFPRAHRSVKNITVFHVNPKQYGPNPLNMDTGDAAGDMFFDMHNVIIMPLECPHGAASGRGCTNPEAVADDLMVNKIVLEVNTDYSGYAKCNIGGPNGTDDKGEPCKNATYCCFCDGGHYGTHVPCNDTLGRANVMEYFGGAGHGYCREEGYECYKTNVAKKFTSAIPGYWYSSLSRSYCAESPVGDSCTWRLVAVEKIIQKKCHNKIFYGAVQDYGKTCFQQCGKDATNSSSACWTNCFYTTVLGPDGGKPGGAVTGMPLEEMVAAWVKPFETPAKGGCPNLKE